MQKHSLITPLWVCVAVFLMGISAVGLLASDPATGDGATPGAASATKPAENANAQVTALKQQMALQQKQIEQMQKTLEEQKRLLEKLTQATPATPQAPEAAKPAVSTEQASAPAKAAGGSQQAVQPHAYSMGQVASTTPMIPSPSKKTENTSTSMGAGTTAIGANSMNGGQGMETSPLQLHIGDASITPVGFMDFTGVLRNHAAGGNIGTSFGSIPYNIQSGGLYPYQTNLSEFRLSIQNSRIGFRTDADVKGAHVIGYMEADFLGTPASTNIAVSSNSQLLRSRLYWVDLRKGDWEILGGQTWSLITPGRVGISPLPADVFYTQDMDVNYQAGLFWGRIPELRFVYHLPSNKAAFAVAIDSPDQYIGGSSGGSTITLPSALSSTSSYLGELDASASSGGIATPDVAPDIIAKLALDPVKQVHFEVGGVERNFKVWYPGVAAVAATATTPAVAAVPSQDYSAEGGGGFVNLHVEIFKGFRLLTNNFWSDGGGRYIFGQAPDLVANANGSISLLHSGSTVTGFEYTHKNTLLFAYYGGIYIGRDTVIDTNKKLVGYGYTGSANSQNRDIQEATFGFNQAIWKHPKYGAVNIIGQYSYLTRDPWYVALPTSSTAPATPRDASLNMVFIDLRYTLPGSAPTLGRPAR